MIRGMILQAPLGHVTGLLRPVLGVVSGDSGGDGPGEAKEGGGESLAVPVAGSTVGGSLMEVSHRAPRNPAEWGFSMFKKASSY